MELIKPVKYQSRITNLLVSGGGKFNDPDIQFTFGSFTAKTMEELSVCERIKDCFLHPDYVGAFLENESKLNFTPSQKTLEAIEEYKDKKEFAEFKAMKKVEAKKKP